MDFQYNITYREKDRGWQYIISYKTEKIGKWKQKSKQGFKKKSDAKKASDKALEILKAELQNTKEVAHDLNDISFYDFYIRYREDNKIFFTAATIETLKNTVNSFKALWGLKLSSIKTYNIQEIIDSLYKKNFKVSTINAKMTYLNMLFNSAVNKYRIISSNPAKNVKLKKEKTEVKRRALEDNEVNELLQALKEDREIYYMAVLTIVTTGIRIGECLGITKSDIDFDNKQLKINKQYKNLGNGTWGLGVLKSRNGNRILPLPSSTIEALKIYLKNNTTAPDGRIFNVGETKSFQSSLNRRIKTLGFNVCLHELRHTYATNLIASGIDFKTAAYLLGHDIEQTMKTYTHVTDSMLQRAKTLIESKY